ncbi:hypothetical protein, partial [Methylobrevis pamukkalensis]|uniref:hypothetical protein n=1 Tax=Methylobrevis pamukkalensis TaxID=1439726 RepID=UPI001AECE801
METIEEFGKTRPESHDDGIVCDGAPGAKGRRWKLPEVTEMSSPVPVPVLAVAGLSPVRRGETARKPGFCTFV